MAKAYESDLEKHILSLFEMLGYSISNGEALEPDGQQGERTHYRQAILENRLFEALKKINASIPSEVCEEAGKKIIDIGFSELLQENHRLYQMMIQGVPIQY